MSAASTIREEVRQMSILIENLSGKRVCVPGYCGGSRRSGGLCGADKTQFTLLNIPCFIDRTRGIVLNPLTEYIKSALEILICDFPMKVYSGIFGADWRILPGKKWTN